MDDGCVIRRCKVMDANMMDDGCVSGQSAGRGVCDRTT